MKELFLVVKNKQKLFFQRAILLTLFMASCASSKKATVREEKVDKVIDAARSFIGTPYRYGGMTRTGMDCSGLLINSFQSVNISLPHSSADQSKLGREIKLDEIEPGDLVFLATGKKKKQVTHVGLVTQVKSRTEIKFIHASSTLGVVETDMFSDYYKKRFRGARRLIE